MDLAKYIIVNRRSPIIFHAGIEHKTEAAGRKVNSAGFVRRSEDGKGFVCFGESVSLGIGSNPIRDAKLIAAMFGGGLG